MLFSNNYSNLVLIFQTTKNITMKKLIITCALLTSASMLSFAQSTQTPATTAAQPNGAPQAHAQQQRPTAEQIAERHAQADKKQFNLDDNQYKGVYTAELEYYKQMLDMRDKGTQPTPDQAQKLRTDKDAKIKAVMTPEQYAKYNNNRPNPQMQPAAPNSNAPTTK
jgi:hypothetical protein